jgi:hypothetical protein
MDLLDHRVPVVEMYCAVALKVVVPKRFSFLAPASMVAAIPESSRFPTSLRPISNILEGNAATSVAHMARAAMQSEYFIMLKYLMLMWGENLRSAQGMRVVEERWLYTVHRASLHWTPFCRGGDSHHYEGREAMPPIENKC